MTSQGPPQSSSFRRTSNYRKILETNYRLEKVDSFFLRLVAAHILTHVKSFLSNWLYPTSREASFTIFHYRDGFRQIERPRGQFKNTSRSFQWSSIRDGFWKKHWLVWWGKVITCQGHMLKSQKSAQMAPKMKVRTGAFRYYRQCFSDPRYLSLKFCGIISCVWVQFSGGIRLYLTIYEFFLFGSARKT